MIATALRRIGTGPAIAICLASIVFCCFGEPQDIRVLPAGTRPHDSRLGALKDLEGYFPFSPKQSVNEWETRAQELRWQMRVALGLWPAPEKTPLNAVIHGKVERDDYTVEKVYFESVPGFFVTGSLYRPKGKAGKLPAILTPHGHWENGRFYDQGVDGVRRQIAEGAEKYEEGGRSPLQSRCVQLARMGCIVFFYDMIGYADSIQIPHSLAHGFSKQRPEMNTAENWGLFSPQAEAHLQSVMGLQTWTSIRALDFLTGLPDVDPERIGVTGASGGGTQTFILCALDPRPVAAFPAVMVSTAMQGGCTCENTSLLRVDTGNVEFAALFAPKPLGMTAADDWTKEMPAKGFPELQKHFAMMGVPEKVHLTPLLQFGHNYNYVSRAAMYAWFNRHLNLGIQEPIVERDYKRLSTAEMSVWDQEHPKPESGPEFERRLLRAIHESSEKKLEAAARDCSSFRELAGNGLKVVIGRDLGLVGPISFVCSNEVQRGDVTQMAGLLRNNEHGEELPVIVLQPAKPNGKTVVWIDANGKKSLFDGSGIDPKIRKLLGAGVTVIGGDLLMQGEFLENDKPVAKSRVVKNPREFAGYTFGYNRCLFSQRTHDVLSLIQFARERNKGGKVMVAGLHGAGPWVAAAVSQAREAVLAAVIDTDGFRFGKLLDWQDANFLPGGAKYGDVPGMIALCAPVKLCVAGESDRTLDLARQQYQNSGQNAELQVFNGEGNEEAAAIEWLGGI